MSDSKTQKCKYYYVNGGFSMILMGRSYHQDGVFRDNQEVLKRFQ